LYFIFPTGKTQLQEKLKYINKKKIKRHIENLNLASIGLSKLREHIGRQAVQRTKHYHGILPDLSLLDVLSKPKNSLLGCTCIQNWFLDWLLLRSLNWFINWFLDWFFRIALI
ncbi:unnamed protein product, partial [Acanthoscelides obtectus]